jgi:hypothetical protein
VHCERKLTNLLAEFFEESMAVKPESKIDIREFNGMIDNFDTEDSPAGASSIQTNMGSFIYGEMSTRRGYKLTAFEVE